jgi:hypothetical protein
MSETIFQTSAIGAWTMIETVTVGRSAYFIVRPNLAGELHDGTNHVTMIR